MLVPVHQILIGDVVPSPNQTVCACSVVLNSCTWNPVVMLLNTPACLPHPLNAAKLVR